MSFAPSSPNALFTATPLRGLPVRGFFVIAHRRGALPGVVFNDPKAAAWFAQCLGGMNLLEDQVLALLSNPLEVQALVRRWCADPEHTTVPTTVTRLLELLDSIGWNQAKLARKLQLDPNTVSRWITGRTPVPAFVLEYLQALKAVKDLSVKLDL